MKTKICSKCSEDLPLDRFNKNKTKKDGYQYYCKECQAKATKVHYENNKSDYRGRVSTHRVEVRKMIDDIKSKSSCKICEENHPACLQFHHSDPSVKDFEIGKCRSFSKEKILQEIEKCEVLCANCHAKIHYRSRV